MKQIINERVHNRWVSDRTILASFHLIYNVLYGHFLIDFGTRYSNSFCISQTVVETPDSVINNWPIHFHLYKTH